MIDRELQSQLKAPFSAADHTERSLPGGGRWFFIPWQKIKERLDECVPDWQVSYSDPLITGESVVIRCKITINEISREGVGNSDAYKERTIGGNYKYGSPIECATADAFKNAAELFGVGAYLDNQDFVVRHLKNLGDHRGTKFAYERGMAEQGIKTKVGNSTSRSATTITQKPHDPKPLDPYDLPPSR
jgi:hypothetical protein